MYARQPIIIYLEFRYWPLVLMLYHTCMTSLVDPTCNRIEEDVCLKGS